MYAQDNILCQFGPKICPSVQQLISQPILIHFWWELYQNYFCQQQQNENSLVVENKFNPIHGRPCVHPGTKFKVLIAYFIAVELINRVIHFLCSQL